LPIEAHPETVSKQIESRQKSPGPHGAIAHADVLLTGVYTHAFPTHDVTMFCIGGHVASSCGPLIGTLTHCAIVALHTSNVHSCPSSHDCPT
jgi:hypothetical protein